MSARSRPLTSAELRRISGDSLLRVLRRGDVMTASELMSATGMSRTSVHEVCADLLRLGWIREVTSQPDLSPTGQANGSEALRPGRPPRRYVYAADAAAVLAVDMGVNTITVHVTDLRGATKGRAEHHLDDPSTADRLRVLDELADQALSTAGVGASHVLVAVIAVPMPVSPRRSIPYPPEQGVLDVARRWAESRHWTVLIENDANLAALGERWHGAAQDQDNVIVLLAGERLGAGIIMGGHLLRGEHGSTGELRFVSLMPDVQPEGLGIGKQARELATRALSGGQATATLRALAERNHDGVAVSAQTVFEAAAAGDESALAIVRTVCHRLARLVGVLATLLDPGIVVISGGLATAGDLLATTTAALLPTEMIDNPPVVAVSPLGTQAVLHGATWLGLEHLEHHVLDDLGR